MSLANQLVHDSQPGCGNSVWAAWGFGLIAAWSGLIGSDGAALAQSITAPAAQAVTHDGSDSPQAFPEVAWQLHSGLDPLGYTVQWSCGPFQHTGRASLKADCKLQIRVLASGGSANWIATVPDDQTDYAGGDQTATVVAQSTAEGDGEVGLTVTFLDNEFSKLGAGTYTVMVTGTITAN